MTASETALSNKFPQGTTTGYFLLFSMLYAAYHPLLKQKRDIYVCLTGDSKNTETAAIEAGKRPMAEINKLLLKL